MQRLRVLVEAAEQAVEAGEEAAAEDRSDEADVLTADWSVDLLNRAEVQALLQRLKDVQEQLDAEADPAVQPGLKAPDEVVTISGDYLRAELQRVKAAERGASYDFPIDLNDKVLTWISLFTTTKRAFIENALGRASQYLPMIRQVFAEEGIPSDLAYLAVIESGFRNEARSRARAMGMWQFIRSTGRIYGLSANAWVEERRDPVKATRAAARYLKRLFEISGDWYLATSSYNAGPLTLDRAIQNLGTRNFWDLSRSRWLRTETKNYVPELCAAILVGRNPDRYGLNIQPLRPYVFETVLVPSMTSLLLLARCADTDVATLKALNPELLRSSTPPGSYTLRVPPGRALDCTRRMSSLPFARRPAYRNYLLRRGDTLASVARRFKVASEELLDANDLIPRQFKAGRRIQIPPTPVLASHDRGGDSTRGRRPLPAVPAFFLPPQPVPAPPSAAPSAVMTPVAAESLGPVAQIVVPKESLDPLAQAVPAATPAGAVVRARPGDTLAKIARANRVPLGQMMRLNPKAGKVLHPGDAIHLPGAPLPGDEPRQLSEKEPSAARIYRVQKGDTLIAIARKHAVTVQELEDWNHLKGGRIQRGQRLSLHSR